MFLSKVFRADGGKERKEGVGEWKGKVGRAQVTVHKKEEGEDELHISHQGQLVMMKREEKCPY